MSNGSVQGSEIRIGPLAGIGNGDAFLHSNFGLESERQEYEICENWGMGKREIRLPGRKTQGTDPESRFTKLRIMEKYAVRLRKGE
jgi:hypothetical protein